MAVENKSDSDEECPCIHCNRVFSSARGLNVHLQHCSYKNRGDFKQSGKKFASMRSLPRQRENCMPDSEEPPAHGGCMVCEKGTNEHVMLLCDSCDDPYHTYCLDPPLEELPPAEEIWVCERCRIEGQQRFLAYAKEKKNDAKDSMPGNMHESGTGLEGEMLRKKGKLLKIYKAVCWDVLDTIMEDERAKIFQDTRHLVIQHNMVEVAREADCSLDLLGIRRKLHNNQFQTNRQFRKDMESLWIFWKVQRIPILSSRARMLQREFRLLWVRSLDAARKRRKRRADSIHTNSSSSMKPKEKAVSIESCLKDDGNNSACENDLKAECSSKSSEKLKPDQQMKMDSSAGNMPGKKDRKLSRKNPTLSKSKALKDGLADTATAEDETNSENPSKSLHKKRKRDSGMNDRNKPELKKGAMSSITRSLELLRAGANQGAERVSSDAKKGSPEVKKTSDPKRRNLCNVNGDSNAKKKIRKISATKNTKPAHEEAETGDSSDEEEILHNVASVASTARPRKKTPIQSSSPDSKNGSENFCDEGSDSDGEKLKDFSVPIIKNEDRESLGQSSHSDSEDENVHEFDWWDKHEDFVDPTLTTHKLRFGVTSDDEEMSGVNNNESVKSKEIKLMISSSVPRNVKYHPMNKNVPWWVDLGNSQIILGDKKSNYYDKLRDETSRRMHINNFDAAHSTDDKERESPTSLEARGIAMIESQGKPDIRSTKEQNSRQCKREADKQEPKDDLGDKMEDRDIQEFEVLEDEKGARIVPQRQVLKENRVSQSEKGEVYASLQSPNGNAAKIEARKRFPPDSSHASMRDTLWKMRMHQIEIKMPYIQAMAEGYAVNARTPFGDKLFTCHRKEWGPHTHLIFRHERDYEEIEEDPTFDFDENSQSNEPWGDCSPDALCCVCKKPAKSTALSVMKLTTAPRNAKSANGKNMENNVQCCRRLRLNLYNQI
eukprot:CAMPEP_0184481092 /NCGR_PEP_ID=MMETSP0113_2-20130426/2630_1 /TAXON_ID=91329 /ORGANISM="Norrisiella sphaerica, Strain BC52" /LENGTH=945 /DNA_ID=CAMNT_0026860007 /DNA_START=731 /DNA_END=3569 /DNA_ORIENTATION=-